MLAILLQLTRSLLSMSGTKSVPAADLSMQGRVGLSSFILTTSRAGYVVVLRLSIPRV